MKNLEQQYTIGIDYGTLSGRAVVVRVSDGAEVGSAVFDYPNAVMDQTLRSSGAKLPESMMLRTKYSSSSAVAFSSQKQHSPIQ